ncbi:Phenylalanine--tRNA ligase [Blattella germanica]|nr:Phenylalanine--tRNA ligase [Blattella germanica]
MLFRLSYSNLRITSKLFYSTVARNVENVPNILINGKHYHRDEWTNVSEKILSHLGRNLHLQKNHPLSLIKQRIVEFIYKRFVGHRGNPIFSVHENLDPIVTVKQNFDSLLIPEDHPSRKKSDCYYVNSNYLLRAHTTAHQADLIGMGLNNFLMLGDVFRRDEIDSNHYPVFKNVDGGEKMPVFENAGARTAEKQETHTLEASKTMEIELKSTLKLNTAGWKHIFPSLILHGNWKYFTMISGWNYLDVESWSKKFLKMLVHMKELDGHLVWPISVYPQCTNDISFWLPKDGTYTPNDFYDLVREVGGDVVEQISLVDEFTHPKKQQTSHCYRIVYRHMEKTLNQEEVNAIHKQIEQQAILKLNVNIR